MLNTNNKEKTQGFMKYGYKLNLEQHILFNDSLSKKITSVNFNKLLNKIMFTKVSDNKIILPRGQILVAISCALHHKRIKNNNYYLS